MKTVNFIKWHQNEDGSQASWSKAEEMSYEEACEKFPELFQPIPNPQA